MRVCWERTIRGLWLSAGFWLLGAGAAAQTLDVWVRRHQEKPSEGARAAVAKAATTPLGQLALASIDIENGRAAEVAGRRIAVPLLDDYAAWVRARSWAERGDSERAIADAEAVMRRQPASPLRMWALLLAARQQMERGQGQRAVELLRANLGSLPKVEGALLYAKALESVDQLGGAALQYQHVYYEFPEREEADAAGAALERLRGRLGDQFPPPTAQAVIGRAAKLIESGQARAGASELQAAMTQLGSAERELARVKLGVARYRQGDHRGAWAYLGGLETASAEADAERLYWRVVASRRLDDDESAARAVDELALRHPASKWRLEGSLYLANAYFVRNLPASYVPLYTVCAEAFPYERDAPGCDWKLAWHHYRTESGEGERRLRDHVARYPESEKAAAALYFLGRTAESRQETGAARAYYEALAQRFPNAYYTVLARGRPEQVRSAKAPEPVVRFLASVPRPPTPAADFLADPASRLRIERARLLASAGLDRWADSELRFGATTDAKPAVMAMELARLAAQRGAPHQGIRQITSLLPAYMRLGLDEAPLEFWKLAFPLPFRPALENRAAEQALDPLLMAALIRQESEFDPKAVSRAQAIGLTQVRPATGREISRKVGLRGYRASMLSHPDVNLRLGAYYLRNLLDSLGGRWEAALAAYNAGRSRAVAWLEWGEFREPAEFIETIPFTETRNYVQIVLRNADLYRRLYGNGGIAVRSTGEARQAVRLSGTGRPGPGAVP